MSDGLHHSAHVPFYIIINPTNDETPSLLLANFTVRPRQIYLTPRAFKIKQRRWRVIPFVPLAQVNEGGVRELTPSILDGLDLDAPPDILTFTVVQPPAHGSLINGIYGTEMNRYKEMGPDLLQRSLPVTSFTLQELRQGERESNKVAHYHGCMHKTLVQFIKTGFGYLIF